MNALTEKQARERWCPLVGHRNKNQATCMASACMAWRFTEQLTDGPDSYQSEPGPTGYCGLAGKPTGE